MSMNRIALTDGSGKWFDEKKATLFKEGTRFDGRNHVSLLTGSQWEHVCLYQTKSGKWIRNDYSNYQGSSESYVEISDSEAAKFFIASQYNDEEIPAYIAPIVQSIIDDLEV